MASTLRERRQQMLREEILAAAHDLLAEKSYAAMSMEELAARVGVSKPTLYRHFPAKQDVVVALAAQILDAIFAHAEAGTVASPLERLLDLLQTAVRIQFERRTDAMQLQMPEIVAILGAHDELRDRVARIDKLIVDLIHAAHAAGEIDPDTDAASVARIFEALICAPHIGRLSTIGPPAPEALTAAVANVFRRGLAPASDPQG